MHKYPNIKRRLKYCEFYENFSHNTTECFNLHENFEYLILSGYLKEFVADIRHTWKSMEQDKNKNVPDTSLEYEAPKGSKKGVYV